MKVIFFLIEALLVLVLFLSAMTLAAHAVPRMYGQDYLALQHKLFKAKEAVQSLQDPAAVGMLDTTFGASLEKPELILKSPKVKYLRIHFFNGSCIRGDRCARNEPTRGYNAGSFQAAISRRDKRLLGWLKERVTLYKNLCAKYLAVQCLISPELEHDLPPSVWRILADTVKAVWPTVQLVNSGTNQTLEPYRGAWIERHYAAGTDVTSMDGNGASDENMDKYIHDTQNNKITFVWERMYNCRSNSLTWVEPLNRSDCPTKEDFDLLSHITDTRPNAPAFTGRVCRRMVPFKAPMIWKPMSEDTGSKDPRRNLPVSITNERVNYLQALSANGKKVGQLRLYGTYLGGQWRHYSGWRDGTGLSGYEFETTAQTQAGSPYIWLYNGLSTCIGPLIGGRRAGTYR